MRFSVVLGLAALSCGGTVSRNQTPGAGGSSAVSGGTTSTITGGASGAPNAGGQGSGTGTMHDGGSVLLTPEQYTELASSACAGWSTGGPERLSPAIELVISADSSMGLAAPGVELSRWEVTQNAVENSFDVWSNDSYLGLIAHPNLFEEATPSPNPQSVAVCMNVDAIVPLAQIGGAGSAQRASIAAAMEAVILVEGHPLGDAFDTAVSELTSFGTPPFVVLIVDGPPTLLQQCINPTGLLTPVDTSELIGQIEQAFVTHGLRTFVVGLPGSEEIRSMLSLAASVGGTAPGCGPLDVCHRDLSPAQDLQSALQTAFIEIGSDIAEAFGPSLVPCSYSIPPPPTGQTIDLEKITVVIPALDGGRRVLLLDEVGECSEGYRFVSPEEIELCPVSCDQLQESSGQIELLFGCSPGGL